MIYYDMLILDVPIILDVIINTVGLPLLPSMDHGEVFKGFSRRLYLRKKSPNLIISCLHISKNIFLVRLIGYLMKFFYYRMGHISKKNVEIENPSRLCSFLLLMFSRLKWLMYFKTKWCGLL